MAQPESGAQYQSAREYPTIGACGLDCGLCPRYYTQGKSRCPGCGGPDFTSKHPSCSFITCCVRRRGLQVCAECPGFPCPKFKTDEEYQQLKESSSYPSSKVIMLNLAFIKEHGISRFIDQQRKRIELLERMIENYDDGRSRSFFCRAACLHELTSLEGAVNEATEKIKADNIRQDGTKARARMLREILNRGTYALRVPTGGAL